MGEDLAFQPDLAQITVIVVTYNSQHCIATLANDLAVFPHIIFSDNASEDGTVAAVTTSLPQAQVLVNSRNLGFGAANNRALSQVRTPFALLLNPDCEIQTSAVQMLLHYMQQDPEAALAAPQLMRTNSAIDLNYRWATFSWQSRGAAAEGPCCVGFVTGAVMLLRMSRFDGLGFFDEDFFLYYEDDDLCLRLFAAQLPIVIVPDARVLHVSRGSVRGKSPWRAEYWRGYHHVQSKILLTRKYRGDADAQRLLWRTRLLACLGLPLRLLLPQPKLVARWCGRLVGAWHSRN
ncbi:MAG: glycosyltransferase family 2 protein [Brachymonas sp.]|nr:glycosyltransferase family 2 protein [Brachymonas sp.]